MARNIEIPKTGKFINVQKLGKKTWLNLGDKGQRIARAESRTFLLLVPIVIPLVMSINMLPAVAKSTIESGYKQTDSSLLIAISEVSPYASLFVTFLIAAITIPASLKITKMFANTESSNIVLSPEDIATIAQEKSEKRTIVQGDITKDSTESIIQSFISQAYPDMIVESQNIEYDYINDRSFSKIFNTEAA